MDFNEVSQSYMVLRQQLASGAITREHYQQQVAKLRFMTPDGVWWQIDPATGGWLTWNGQTWIPATAAGQFVQQHIVVETSQTTSAKVGRSSRRLLPKQEPAPQTLWQLAALMLRSWLENLPSTIVSSIVIACATWFFHTWLLVGPNNTMLYPTKPILGWMIDTMQNPRGGVAFWAVVSYFVASFLGRLFSAPIASAKGIVLSPSWLVRAFLHLRAKALIPFLLGGTVAVVIGSTMRNYMSAWAYAAGFLLVTMALDMSFEHMVLRLALSDLRRFLKVRLAPYGAESDYAFLLFPGLALGFASSAMVRTPARWARFTFWGALVIVLFAVGWSMWRRKAARATGVLLLVLAVVCTVVIALTPVLADDGGWAESGRTIQGLTRNAGWPMTKKLGIPPAEAALLAGLLATNLGAAYGYMKKHGIDPTKLGLPDTPPPPGMNVAPDSVPSTPEQRKARAEKAAENAAKAQAEAEEANSWGGLLSQAWKNWEKEAVQIGDAVSNVATGAKDVVVKGATSIYEGAKSVYNDPSIVTTPLKNFAKDVATAAQDAWNNPQLIWDTASGTWKDVKTGVSGAVDVGGKIISGVASGIYTTLTDPKKMWEAVKDSGGWDNWVKSWDPNVPVLERFGNVFIGTAKIGMTILTAGQAKAAIMAGKEILTVAGAQILKGDLKAAGKSLINGIIKTFASGETKAAQTIADDAAKLKGGTLRPVGSAVPSTGISPNNLKTIQEGTKKFGLEAGVRPQGTISGFVKNGVAKGPDIKNKSIDGVIDGLIGGKGPEGAIGHFKPDEAAAKNLIEGIKGNPGILPNRQAQMIKEIEDRVALRKAEFAGPKVNELINNEKKLVPKGGVLVDTASGKPVITDLDLFKLTKAGGAPVTAAEEKAFVQWCQAKGVPVTHGAHMNWVPTTPDEYKIFEKIIQGHGVGGKPIITVGADGAVGAANYIPPVR